MHAKIYGAALSSAADGDPTGLSADAVLAISVGGGALILAVVLVVVTFAVRHHRHRNER